MEKAYQACVIKAKSSEPQAQQQTCTYSPYSRKISQEGTQHNNFGNCLTEV